jgi:hypothetical protein
MKNMVKLFGIIALIAVIGFSMSSCKEEEDSSSGGDIDSAAWAQLEGTWEKSRDFLRFWSGGKEQFGKEEYYLEFGPNQIIEFVTKNKVSTTGSISFNFSVSGDKLTVSNWSSVLYDGDGYNGVYTKRVN